MNVISLISSFLHVSLLIITYLILPEFAPEDQRESIKHWVLTSFSAIFLLLIMVSAKDEVNIFVILFVGAISLTGIVWWVPTYIPAEDQELVSHLLIVSSSIFITMISTLYSLHETESLGMYHTNILNELVSK
jgi:hypothetical protein